MDRFGNKINELVKAINEIRKDLNKEHCCCCGVEITDENRALHNMCNECKYGIDWEEKTKWIVVIVQDNISAIKKNVILRAGYIQRTMGR